MWTPRRIETPTPKRSAQCKCLLFLANLKRAKGFAPRPQPWQYESYDGAAIGSVKCLPPLEGGHHLFEQRPASELQVARPRHRWRCCKTKRRTPSSIAPRPDTLMQTAVDRRRPQALRCEPRRPSALSCKAIVCGD